MELRQRLARTWEQERHLRHLSEGEWEPMYDDRGRMFAGIEGKHGVRDIKADGTAIGCDFIRMQPGSAFPLHWHEGDHELYVISGEGFVHIDGREVAVMMGHVIHIPAEYPHGVWVGPDATEPLVFAATGHPHHQVDSIDRMTTIDTTENRSVPDRTPLAPDHHGP